MEDYINQLRKTAEAEIPYFTLIGTLILIDICSALNSKNGETNRNKFKNWYRKNLPDYHDINEACDFDAEECYKLRCRMLHQGRAEIDHDKLNKNVKSGKITFRIGPGKVHRGNVNGLYYLDIELFMEDVISAAEKWYQHSHNKQHVKNNRSKLMKIVDKDPGMLVGNGTYIY